MGKNLLKVLKAENNHVCICAMSRKAASKPVQAVDDGGMNGAPREGKASAEKLKDGLKIREDAQAVPPWQPPCGDVPGCPCHGRGLPETSSSKARSCGVARVRDKAMPAQPGPVPAAPAAWGRGWGRWHEP